MRTVEFADANIDSDGLFPLDIESRDWVAYHATSSTNATSIERDGFWPAKAVPAEAFRILKNWATALSLPFDNVQGFQGLTLVSFSPLSKLCLAYTNQERVGGQGVGYVGAMAAAILGSTKFPVDSHDADSLRSICNSVSEIQAGSPVVYAVDLNGQSRLQYQTMTKALHAYAPVAASRIIAKIELPRHDYSGRIELTKLKKAIDILAFGSGNHYIKRMLAASDLDDA